MAASNIWHEIDNIGYAQQGAENLIKKLYSTLNKNQLYKFDMHGFNASEAHQEVQARIEHAIQCNFRYILFIHGIGKGIIKNIIWDYCVEHPNLLACLNAPSNFGGNGATLIIAKRRRNDT